MNRDKITETVLIVLGVICFITLMVGLASGPVYAQEEQPILRPVDTTGYYDYLYHWGIGYDGRKLVEGLTVAGPKEWLGKSCALYDENYKLIGIYEFRDIGYGKSLGFGSSKVRKGAFTGDIEVGLCIDIYFEKKQDALNWGRQKCYMQLIEAVG